MMAAQTRREIIIAIRNYIDSLPHEERYCNDCKELQVSRTYGARGQMVMPFGEGVCRCDEHVLMWAYRGSSIVRPLECILNGKKHLEGGGD